MDIRDIPNGNVDESNHPDKDAKDIAANQIFNAPKPKNPKNKRPMPEEGYH
ncbi:hypothetical protein QTP88_015266 [Uroleucon formosanum]